MRRTLHIVIFIIILLFTTTHVIAAELDCALIKTRIKHERNLLKKQKLLDFALQQCAQDAEIYYLGAYAAERLRKYDRAQRNYLKATELDNKYDKAYFGLGDIYMVLGNVRSAISAYEKGLALIPQNKRARSSLELARIKFRSATGGKITSAEFIQVMEESKTKETTQGAVDGPLLRMQIRFNSASSQLPASAIEQLAVVGKALENPVLRGKKFEIGGHTDAVGAPDTNLALSKRRAEAVREYLLKEFSIQPEVLMVAYYGDTRPAAPNTTIENRSMNRRVEFKRLSKN